jgi:predicted enzyme related to lactoylglutathione lyase
MISIVVRPDRTNQRNVQLSQEGEMIDSIAFTVYPVQDMPRARAFYEGALGLKLSANFNDQWIEYDLANGTFALTTTDMGHPPGSKGAIVGFETGALDALMRRLGQANVPVVVAAFDTPVCRMAVVADPDDNHVTLHQRR